LEYENKLSYMPMFGILVPGSPLNQMFINPRNSATCDYRVASSAHSGVINAALADGSARTVSAGVEPAVWAGALTPSGGETISTDW
jgi:hypothetical protein